MATRAHRAPLCLLRIGKLAVLLILISGLFVQNSFSLTSYTRQELLDIGSLNFDCFSSNLRLSPELIRPTDATQATHPAGSARRRRKDGKQRRGKRGGIRAKLKLTPHRLSLPSLFLANVRSLVNKMDELRLRMTNSPRISNCNVTIFTETWLHNGTPDDAIKLAGYHTLRADRSADDSGKARGGGLCIYINKDWCTNSVIVGRHCSANLEFLMVKCRPFYLPREFTSAIVTAAYIPPDANAKLAMDELHAAISKQQTAHPEAAFIVAGDFNHSNLKTVLPKFHQHVSCHTRGDKTLDHVYTNIKGAYTALPLPHLGQSDHLSLFLIPRYAPLINRVKPTVKTVKVWPAGVESVLQNRFEDTDWSMFASEATCGSHTDIDSYSHSVLEYINKTIDSVTTEKQITTYPNQKPWMSREVRLLLKERNRAFRSADAQAYSTSRANLKRGIKKAKHEYKLKVEEHFINSDPRRMWQGIQAITDYKPSNSSPSVMDMPFLQELNNFYARFDKENKDTATKTELSVDHQTLTLPPSDVQDALSKINARKAAGPDGIPGRVLRACAEQLAGVLTDIFNLSLAQASVPACFKTTSIVPVPKHSSPSCLNDYRPVALTPIVMKCFERLVLAHLKKCLPTSLDPHQFAYQNNRSTDDAVSTALHCVLSHLDNKNTYARLLFVDFSSAFNTVIPSKLITKLGDLGISTPLCNWILDFLTNRPQHVRSGHDRSTTLILNTGAPQGCVLSPFLYSLFTHDCKPKYGSNSIIKFADDTTVIGLITNNDESDYRAEVQHLAVWCADNNLLLNTSKTKELIVDFRKEKGETHNPIQINGMAVERVSSFKFLGTHISENLTWAINTSSLVKKANQRLFFLRTLKKNHLSADILCNFYRCAIESILTNCITAWYGNCSVADRKSLQRVVKTAQRITGTPLPAIEVVRKKRCLNRARSILKDPSHPANRLFQLLPSRRRFRSLQTKTSRFRNSFFPTAVSLLNSVPR
ncbi:RNA-directed DNA polymerase from mobile element jockey [Merluccius polli]|uniref:RNA-directed DNA polymerase from mobile element jockey n=1 Tax=Merluccius polli TaxID=89951 RepID=A0AA47P3D0_MERPO|nr:RNA-directed DNA polymerase from mobile element jockey [Merluccius polli]